MSENNKNPAIDPRVRLITTYENTGRGVRILPIHILMYNPDDNPVRIVKEACLDYVTSSRTAWENYNSNCDEFNWADFIENVPDEICEKHGFQKLQVQVCDDMNHRGRNLNELLVSEDEIKAPDRAISALAEWLRNLPQDKARDFLADIGCNEEEINNLDSLDNPDEYKAIIQECMSGYDIMATLITYVQSWK